MMVKLHTKSSCRGHYITLGCVAWMIACLSEATSMLDFVPRRRTVYRVTLLVALSLSPLTHFFRCWVKGLKVI